LKDIENNENMIPPIGGIHNHPYTPTPKPSSPPSKHLPSKTMEKSLLQKFYRTNTVSNHYFNRMR